MTHSLAQEKVSISKHKFISHTATHLFAQAHLHIKRTLPSLKKTTEDPRQGCQFCAGSTELPWARYTISKSYYGGNFTDYALMRAPNSNAICAAWSSRLEGRSARLGAHLFLVQGLEAQ